MALDNSKAMYLFHEYAAADCAVTSITSSSTIVLQPIHINHPSLALTKAFYRKNKMIRMRPWYLRTIAQHPVVSPFTNLHQNDINHAMLFHKTHHGTFFAFEARKLRGRLMRSC